MNLPSNANRGWAQKTPYECFYDFIDPNADRFTLLSNHIEKLGLNSVVIPIEENRHFFIFPKGINLKPSTGGSFPYRKQSPVILTAHYDRVPGSPGANDNSAAVFQLLGAALRLVEQNIDYWIIIFTDKEELQNGERIQQQGSFSLAKKLKALDLSGARIFNFDACGTGDTFVFSITIDYLLKKSHHSGFTRARQTIGQLREKAFDTARFLRFNKTLLAPTPFSDDVGFLQGGIPVQTITVLPSAEVKIFSEVLIDRPGFIDMLIDGSIKEADNINLIPETWRCLNSPSDNLQRLTPEFFERITRFAVELCRR